MASSFPVPLVPNKLTRPPVFWSVAEVKEWVEFCVQEFSLSPVACDRFNMNGKALMLLNRADFMERAPQAGDVLYNAFKHLNVASSSGPSYTFNAPMKTRLYIAPKEVMSLDFLYPPTPTHPHPPGSLPFLPMLSHPYTPNESPGEDSNDSNNATSNSKLVDVEAAAGTPRFNGSDSIGDSGPGQVESNHVTVLRTPDPSSLLLPASILSPATTDQSFSDSESSFSYVSRSPKTSDSPLDRATILSTTHGVTTHGVTTHGVTTHGVTTHGVTTHGVTTHGMTTHGMTTHGMTTHGMNCDVQRTVHKPLPGENGECRLLWEFIYQLLIGKEEYQNIVIWESESDFTFRIKSPSGLAKLWGLQKKRCNMTYEKLSRALRHYYKLNIIHKVPGKKLTYQFLQCPSTISKGHRGPKPSSNKRLHSSCEGRKDSLIKTEQNEGSHDQHPAILRESLSDVPESPISCPSSPLTPQEAETINSPSTYKYTNECGETTSNNTMASTDSSQHSKHQPGLDENETVTKLPEQRSDFPPKYKSQSNKTKDFSSNQQNRFGHQEMIRFVKCGKIEQPPRFEQEVCADMEVEKEERNVSNPFGYSDVINNGEFEPKQIGNTVVSYYGKYSSPKMKGDCNFVMGLLQNSSTHSFSTSSPSTSLISPALSTSSPISSTVAFPKDTKIYNPPRKPVPSSNTNNTCNATGTMISNLQPSISNLLPPLQQPLETTGPHNNTKVFCLPAISIKHEPATYQVSSPVPPPTHLFPIQPTHSNPHQNHYSPHTISPTTPHNNMGYNKSSKPISLNTPSDLQQYHSYKSETYSPIDNLVQNQYGLNLKLIQSSPSEAFTEHRDQNSNFLDRTSHSAYITFNYHQSPSSSPSIFQTARKKNNTYVTNCARESTIVVAHDNGYCRDGFLAYPRNDLNGRLRSKPTLSLDYCDIPEDLSIRCKNDYDTITITNPMES